MTGFVLIALLYALAWAVVLAPAAFVWARSERQGRVPDDRPAPQRHLASVARELAARARPADAVPVVERPSGRRRWRPVASGDVVRLAGPVTIGDGATVAVGLVVDGDLRCGEGARLLAPVRVSGRVHLGDGSSASTIVANGSVTIGAGARVDGPVRSRRRVVLGPNGSVRAAFAPIVCGAPTIDEDVEPVPVHEPLEPPQWTSELDGVLDDLWPRQMHVLTEEFAAAAGEPVRGVHLMRRARELGLLERGIAPRPRFLGRRPAWVLGPEAIRVGADLRIAPGAHVSHTLIVEGALEIFHDAQIEASVRSGRGLLVHAGAHVHGRLVSDGLIVCEEGSAVWGPIDSSNHVVLFANARAGTRGFGGVSAAGAIGLEPGAVIVGGAVAGLVVRGEPMRPASVRERARLRPEAPAPPKQPRRRRRASGSSASSETRRRGSGSDGSGGGER